MSDIHFSFFNGFDEESWTFINERRFVLFFYCSIQLNFFRLVQNKIAYLRHFFWRLGKCNREKEDEKLNILVPFNVELVLTIARKGEDSLVLLLIFQNRAIISVANEDWEMGIADSESSRNFEQVGTVWNCSKKISFLTKSYHRGMCSKRRRIEVRN